MEVPAREVPIPTSISAEAQAIFVAGVISGGAHPPLDDKDAWRKMIAEGNEMVTAMLGGDSTDGMVVEDTEVDGVRTFKVSPTDRDACETGVYLDVHGGALISGAGDLCRIMGTRTARRLEMRVWAPDYRMPPDHPYPTPLDDCIAAYRGLLNEHAPEEIAVGGGSAGANLAAALLLRARDEGLPLPAACVLLSNTVRMHRALRNAGIAGELHVIEAAPHGGFMVDTPEERDVDADLRRFFGERLASPR